MMGDEASNLNLSVTGFRANTSRESRYLECKLFAMHLPASASEAYVRTGNLPEMRYTSWIILRRPCDSQLHAGLNDAGLYSGRAVALAPLRHPNYQRCERSVVTAMWKCTTSAAKLFSPLLLEYRASLVPSVSHFQTRLPFFAYKSAEPSKSGLRNASLPNSGSNIGLAATIPLFPVTEFALL